MPASSERPGAGRWVPEGGELADLRAAAPACRGCELWRSATQLVFSTGGPSARLMIVGEQPGDREDLEGAPFVAPRVACSGKPSGPPGSPAARSISRTP